MHTMHLCRRVFFSQSVWRWQTSAGHRGRPAAARQPPWSPARWPPTQPLGPQPAGTQKRTRRQTCSLLSSSISVIITIQAWSKINLCSPADCVCEREEEGPGEAGRRHSLDEGQTTAICRCRFAHLGWNTGCPWHSAGAWSPLHHPFPLWCSSLPALIDTHPPLSAATYVPQPTLITALITKHLISTGVSCFADLQGFLTLTSPSLLRCTSVRKVININAACGYWCSTAYD